MRPLLQIALFQVAHQHFEHFRVITKPEDEMGQVQARVIRFVWCPEFFHLVDVTGGSSQMMRCYTRLALVDREASNVSLSSSHDDRLKSHLPRDGPR